MIDSLQRISQRLALLKPLLLLLGSASLLTLIAEIFFEVVPEKDDVLMIPAIVLFLWSLIFYLALNTFQAVPTSAIDETGFLVFLKRRFSRAFYYSLAFLFSILTVTAAYMSYKIVGIYLD